MELNSRLLSAEASRALPIVLGSVLVCYCLFKLSPYVFSRTIGQYVGLEEVAKRNWDSRVPSTIHALIISAAALMIMYDDLFGSSRPGPYVKRTSYLTYISLEASLGYFFVDLALVSFYYPQLGGVGMVVHHIAGVISLVIMISTGVAHHYSLILLSSELTTPFTNMRWWLDKGGLKSTTTYMVNGILLFIGWFLFRVVLFFGFFWLLWTDWPDIQKSIPLLCQILIVVVPALLTVLNGLWFYKISLGVVKMISAPTKAVKEV